MEMVLNRCFGGFCFSSKAAELLGLETPYDTVDIVDPKVIKVVKDLGSKEASGSCARLKVISIPAKATDWLVKDYDGYQSVIYVVDGKLYEK